MMTNTALDSAREIDINGFITVKDNPIIREGVFPYLGSSLDPAGRDPSIDPDKVYYVYRPADEINNEDTISSMKMIPFVDEHAMLGPSDEGYLPAEKKGVQGSTGESIAFRNGVLYSNIKIFSEALANLIKSGKKELSLGYRCNFVKQAGTFAGQAYDFIQRSLRGNHLALVEKGRNNVSVLDKSIVFDHFDLNIEKEKKMPSIDELIAQVAALDEQVKTVSAENKKLQAAFDEKDKEDEKAEDEDDKEKEKDKAEDEDDDKKEDKAEDEDTQKDPPEKAVEMKNSALDEALKQINKLQSDMTALKKTGVKSLVSEVSQRNSLASRLAPYIGTFDHEDKTLDEVAKYGVEKLGLKCPDGHEATALDSYLYNRPLPGAATYAHDHSTKAGSKSIDAYINGKA